MKCQFWLLFGERRGHSRAWIAPLGAGLPRGHALGPISPGPRGWSNGVLPGSLRRATHLPSTARQGGLVRHPSGTPMSLHVGSRQSDSTVSLRPGPISGGHAGETLPQRGNQGPTAQAARGRWALRPCGWRDFSMRALGWGCRRPLCRWVPKDCVTFSHSLSDVAQK